MRFKWKNILRGIASIGKGISTFNLFPDTNYKEHSSKSLDAAEERIQKAKERLEEITKETQEHMDQNKEP